MAWKYTVMANTRITQKELDEDMTVLGKRICTARKAAKFTAEQLATAAGVSKDTVERMEQGKLGYFPSVHRVAKVLNISLTIDNQPTTSNAMVHELVREIRSKIDQLETII